MPMTLTHSRQRMLALLGCAPTHNRLYDYFEDRNFYQRAKNRLCKALLRNVALEEVVFHLTDESTYGGILWFTIGNSPPEQFSKAKVRWGVINDFYQLYPKPQTQTPNDQHQPTIRPALTDSPAASAAWA